MLLLLTIAVSLAPILVTTIAAEDREKIRRVPKGSPWGELEVGASYPFESSVNKVDLDGRMVR